jgi:hypothetical protein
LDTERAAVEITKITCQLLELNPVVIFKKIDSVLRGHVAAELEAQMKAMGKARALIVAANPSLGRTIVNGQYFVGGVPLAETSFSDDPDFPVHTSVVTDIVTSDHFPVVSIEWNREIPLSGLVIANVATPDDCVNGPGALLRICNRRWFRIFFSLFAVSKLYRDRDVRYGTFFWEQFFVYSGKQIPQMHGIAGEVSRE